MLQLHVTDDRGVVTRFIPEKFPFHIGRSSAAELCLEAAGVWDIHASIHLSANGRFVIFAEGDAVILARGEPINTKELLVGEELALGAARVVVSLAPARQASLGAHELVVWSVLLLAIIAEVIVIFTVR